MRIALITSMKYGLTQFIYRDVAALRAKGHAVDLFSLRTQPGLYNPEPNWNVIGASRIAGLAALARLAVGRPFSVCQLLLGAVRSKSVMDLVIAAQFSPHMKDYDLVFSYFGDHKLFVGYYIKLITGSPLAVTVRAYELYRNPNPDLFVRALAGCDAVLTITKHNRDLLQSRFGVPEGKIQIVRQIVDLDSFRSKPTVKILIVGFFAEKKGHETLFRAIAKLGRDDVEVWVVGDDTPSVLSFDVRGLARELGIEDRVAFFGAQRDVALRAMFRECDVFCLPSRTDRLGDKEGFPNVIAEAMASGKPIVTTRHAGIPEAIDEILVDENAVDDLAEALRRVVDDPTLRQRLGAENRKRAEVMFSSRNNDDLEQALQSVVDRHRSTE